MKRYLIILLALLMSLSSFAQTEDGIPTNHIGRSLSDVKKLFPSLKLWQGDPNGNDEVYYKNGDMMIVTMKGGVMVSETMSMTGDIAAEWYADKLTKLNRSAYSDKQEQGKLVTFEYDKLKISINYITDSQGSIAQMVFTAK